MPFLIVNRSSEMCLAISKSTIKESNEFGQYINLICVILR